MEDRRVGRSIERRVNGATYYYNEPNGCGVVHYGAGIGHTWVIVNLDEDGIFSEASHMAGRLDTGTSWSHGMQVADPPMLTTQRALPADLDVLNDMRNELNQTGE